MKALSPVASSESVGSRFKKWRKMNHLSQSQIAQMINTTYNYISMVEHGRRGLAQSSLMIFRQEIPGIIDTPLDVNWLLDGRSMQNQRSH